MAWSARAVLWPLALSTERIWLTMRLTSLSQEACRAEKLAGFGHADGNFAAAGLLLRRQRFILCLGGSNAGIQAAFRPAFHSIELLDQCLDLALIGGLREAAALPEVPVLPETALLWAGVSASACASREAASEEASLSAMAEAEVSSAGGAVGRAAALGGTCRGADGLHGDDAGQVGQCIQGQLYR